MNVDAGQNSKYVERCKGNRENIPAIKHQNGKLITDPKEKANSLKFIMCLYSGAKVKFCKINKTLHC